MTTTKSKSISALAELAWWNFYGKAHQPPLPTDGSPPPEDEQAILAGQQASLIYARQPNIDAIAAFDGYGSNDLSKLLNTTPYSHLVGALRILLYGGRMNLSFASKQYAVTMRPEHAILSNPEFDAGQILQTAITQFYSGGRSNINRDLFDEDDFARALLIAFAVGALPENPTIEGITQQQKATYRSLQEAVVSAYYTPLEVAKEMWNIVENAGFKGGFILEPACGTGNILAAMPKEIATNPNTTVFGIDKESLSLSIAQLRNPKATFLNEGFENVGVKDFGGIQPDLVITNVPFAPTAPVDAQFTPTTKLNGLHNYFLAKSLELLKPGGILVAISSTNSLDAITGSFKEYAAKIADFIGAIRMPLYTFDNTSVGADILVFQKRTQENPTSLHNPDFLNLAVLRTENAEVHDGKGLVRKTFPLKVNAYFSNNPNAVAGKVVYGYEVGLKLNPYSQHRGSYDTLCVPTFINIDNASKRRTQDEKSLIYYEIGKAVDSIFGQYKFYEKGAEAQKPAILRKLNTKHGCLEVTQVKDNLNQINDVLVYTHPNGEIFTGKEITFLYPNYSITNKKPTTPAANKRSKQAPQELRGIFASLFDADEEPNSADSNAENNQEEGVEQLPQYTMLASAAFGIAIDYCKLKNTIRELRNMEKSEDYSDADISAKRLEMQGQYKSLKSKVGYLSTPSSEIIKRISMFDSDFGLVSGALEIVERNTVTLPGGGTTFIKSVKTAPFYFTRTLKPYKPPSAADNIEDALQISINLYNGINLPHMAKLLGYTNTDDVVQQLVQGDLAYECPDTYAWLESTEYLSGAVRGKLRRAQQAAAQFPSRFDRNVIALIEALPPTIDFDNIIFDIGARWIPPKVYEDFAKEKLGVTTEIFFKAAISSYKVNPKSGTSSFSNTTEFAGGGATAIELYKLLLNLQVIEIRIQRETENGKVSIRSEELSAQAQEAGVLIKEAFKEWVTTKTEYHKELEDIYNDTLNCFTPQKIKPPTFTTYPGASTYRMLYPHQKQAVAKALRGGTALWHFAGAGKTIEMATICAEMLRLGLATKILVDTTNDTTEQIAREFRAQYPNMKVLSPAAILDTQTDKSLANKMFLAHAAFGDYEVVISPRSLVNMIPDDPEALINELYDRMSAFETTLETLQAGSPEHYRLSKKIAELDESIATHYNTDTTEVTQILFADNTKGKSARSQAIKGMAEKRRLDLQSLRAVYGSILFPDFGFDALIVDEAHAYKRLGFSTNMVVKGIDTQGSKRSLSMLLKIRHIQKLKGGKNVVFASGTMVTNTLAELWTMIKYLRPDLLEQSGISLFDSFAGAFTEQVTMPEITPGGLYKAVTRLIRFRNVPELLKLMHVVFDVATPLDIQNDVETAARLLIPKLANDDKISEIIVPKNSFMIKVTNYFRGVLAEFERMTGVEKMMNRHIPLVVYGLAKKAAIDAQLYDPELQDNKDSKLNFCIANVLRLYQQSSAYNGTQLVFCDWYQATNKRTKKYFNVYESIKEKLCALGVPDREVAIFHHFKKAEDRKRLFDDVNAGRIRILLGGAGMAVGVNVQERCVALHSLDLPDLPMLFEQREKRVKRQGNIHALPEYGGIVHHFVYAVEGSMDGAAATRVAMKQGFIAQLIGNKEFGDRIVEDPANMIAGLEALIAEMMGSAARQKHLISQELKAERNKTKMLANKIAAAKTALRQNASLLPFYEDRIKVAQVNYSLIEQTFYGGQFDSDKKPHVAKIDCLDDDGKVYVSFTEKIMEKLTSLYKGLTDLVNPAKGIYLVKQDIVINDKLKVTLKFFINQDIGSNNQIVRVNFTVPNYYSAKDQNKLGYAASATTPIVFFSALSSFARSEILLLGEYQDKLTNAIKNKSLLEEQSKQVVSYAREKELGELYRKAEEEFKKQLELDLAIAKEMGDDLSDMRNDSNSSVESYLALSEGEVAAEEEAAEEEEFDFN